MKALNSPTIISILEQVVVVFFHKLLPWIPHFKNINNVALSVININFKEIKTSLSFKAKMNKNPFQICRTLVIYMQN